MANAYAADGVNVSEGDSFSAFAGGICRSTYGNNPYVTVNDMSRGHFRGPRTFNFKGLPAGYAIDAAPDGIGTKVVLIDAASSYRQAARDLVAMTCGDITRFGGLPAVFINVLDVKTLGKHGGSAGAYERATNQAFRNLMEGLGEVCREQNLVAFKGETAELGVCVSSENRDAMAQFNWAGTAIGVYHPDKMVTGETLAPGQCVVAFREVGFRSNGVSSVRKALSKKFGAEWYRNPKAAAAILAAAQPSVLYDRFLSWLNGWFEADFVPIVKAHLIVHVTGGAIRSKFGEDVLFPRGLSAHLDMLWEPPEIMRQCAEWRGMSDEECYETWNGGQGALVVVDECDYEILEVLAKKQGLEARLCGRITDHKNPRVTIRSKFNGKEITFAK